MLCFIVVLIIGVCAFLGILYLVKNEITDFGGALYFLTFDIWFGFLIFLFTYVGLEPGFIG